MRIDSISIVYCEESIHFTIRSGKIKAFIEVFDNESILNIFMNGKITYCFSGSLQFVKNKLREILMH